MAVLINFHIPDGFQRKSAGINSGSGKIIEFPRANAAGNSTGASRVATGSGFSTRKQAVVDAALRALIWPADV